MFRSLILAAVLGVSILSAPIVANAGEITLLPSIKLQIGDRDHYGNYWDGAYWRDSGYWHRHWYRHDNGWHRGWYKNQRNAYERGYHDGRKDSHHHKGPGKGHHGHGKHH